MSKKTYGSNVKKIEASIGDLFTIELQGQPGAGYQWQVTAPGTVRLIDREVKPGKNIGEPSKESLTFEPVAAGNAVIHLECKRPWETEAVEARDLEVRVK